MADRFVSIGIVLLAVLILGFAFYEVASTQKVAASISLKLSMRTAKGGTTLSVISPYPNIGEPGGIFASARYLQDGVNGFYPVYTIDTSGTIHVQSRVARNYTLGDFFEVWGQPLGPTNTLGVKQNGTSQGTLYFKQFFWDMCLVNPGSPATSLSEYPSFEWGSHVLRNGEIIDLLYSPDGCA